jgi:ABC-2 type transport system ATP-binding protein
MRSTGHTVVLTTHYMEEAETLCDRVAIIDHGRILAMDTPSRLVDAVSRESVIECRFAGAAEEDDMRALAAVVSVVNDDGGYTITTADLPATLMALASFAATNGSAISDMSVHRPTLEDVFVTLTGRALRD